MEILNKQIGWAYRYKYGEWIFSYTRPEAREHREIQRVYINIMSNRYDDMIEKMQTPEHQAAVDALFSGPTADDIRPRTEDSGSNLRRRSDDPKEVSS